MDNNENFNDIPDQLQDEPIGSFDDVYNDEFNGDDLYSNNNINYDDGLFNAPQQNSSDIPKRNNSYSLNKKSSSSDDGTYKAKNRKEELEKEKSIDSNKKATKVATQAAATALAGPAGGKIASVVNNTEIGNKIHDKLATKMEEASHRNPMARKMQKSLNKLNDAGALDAAQTGVDMMGNPEGAAQNAAAKGASNVQNAAKAVDKANGIKSKASDLKNKFTGNGIFDNKKSSINASEDEKKKIIRKKIINLIKAHPWLLAVIGVFFLIIIILLLMGGAAGADDVETSDSDINYNYSSACSEFPMKTTSLTKDEFRELLENNLVPTSDAIKERDGIEVFIENADTIYEIATENNINPELVVVRAALEGFTPGFEGGVQTNNYWGLGVGNGTHDGIHYESFDVGVLEFVRNVSQYSTVAHMMSKYAYIGDYWANAGDNSLGGCTYVTYMQPHYENKERAAEVLEICSRNSCPYAYNELGDAYVTNPSSCEPTNADDQLAYGGYQAESMVSKRQTIFKLSPEDCSASSDFGDFSRCIIFQQNDPQWASKKLGTTDTSMGEAGCAVTSVSIGISCFGENYDESFTPGDYIDMADSSEYVSSCFDGANIYWSCPVIQHFAPNIKYVYDDHTGLIHSSNEEKISIIDSYDHQKYFFIIQLYNESNDTTHYVLLNKIDRENGTFDALDPNNTNGISTKEIARINEIRVFTK